ncbi:MGDG synthase family glycosyltransferase [Thermogemmatispora onikobensis]|uniref:MGDG synthase family glycosyltransferase n=1 Tax=Thermogemmatispora onikobensis TaxID=732234 RepID=UPI0008532796|nr:glycosyltransferase [Thermogemmatispora onikobensis]
MSQRCIVFLISDTGGGHRSAALAISSAIQLLQERAAGNGDIKRGERGEAEAVVEAWPGPGNGAGASPERGRREEAATQLRLEIIEAFEECGALPLRQFARLYGPASRYTPGLYGLIFHLSNHPGRINEVQQLLSPLMLKKLEQRLSELQPDVIVSAHPLLNYVTVAALRHLARPVPFLVVVTDLVSAHHSWFTEGTTAYVLPTEETRQLYLARGLDPKRVHLLGMPIHPRFTLPVASREELRAQLGLEPERPVVLLVGGGEGSGGLRTAVKAISQARLPVQLLVVTGRNRRLYAQLQKEQGKWQVPAKIMGFVTNMPELMHAADVIVTKAGPGTICEALACNLPIILSGYVPGQEEGNVTFVERNGVGVLAQEPRQLVRALQELLEPGSTLLQERIENARRLSRPQAAFDIARLILSYLPPPGQPGPWEERQALTQAAAVRVKGR